MWLSSESRVISFIQEIWTSGKKFTTTANISSTCNSIIWHCKGQVHFARYRFTTCSNFLPRVHIYGQKMFNPFGWYFSEYIIETLLPKWLLRNGWRGQEVNEYRRPEWKVWFAFYGDMKNEAQAMESIDWK